jgi:glutamyl-tRNA reductase
MNPITCVSINHRTAPVALRERITINPADLADLLGEGREAYTINTCNRTEVYAVGIDHAAIYDRLHGHSGIDLSTLRSSSESFTTQDAVRHLFRVAAGLDSLVLGEPQILGQVKDAYRAALAAKTTGI